MYELYLLFTQRFDRRGCEHGACGRAAGPGQAISELTPRGIGGINEGQDARRNDVGDRRRIGARGVCAHMCVCRR